MLLLYFPFNICRIYSNILSLTLDISNFFFLISLARDLLILLIFSNNKVFGFIDFLFLFCFDFIDSIFTFAVSFFSDQFVFNFFPVSKVEVGVIDLKIFFPNIGILTPQNFALAITHEC